MTGRLLASHLRQAFRGGSMTGVGLAERLSGLPLASAAERRAGGNSVLALVYHIGYYLDLHNRVLAGGPIEGSDRFSFDHPDIGTDAEWEALVASVFDAGERWASAVEALSAAELEGPFADGEYGSLAHNLLGLLEHTQYHIGQVSLLVRILQKQL